MPGFNNSQTPQTQNTLLLSLLAQPRFLRAIPSLMVLTTAIAWGASSHAGGLAIDGALHGGTGLTVAAGHALGAGVGVGLGANTGVKAASGMADGDAAGSAAVRTGKRATQGAKAEASGGLKGSVGATTSATVDNDAGAGVKGVTPAR